MEPTGVEITLLPVKTRAIQQEKDEFCEEAKKKKENVYFPNLILLRSPPN